MKIPCGNRCQHNPLAPVYYQRSLSKAGLPDILVQGKARMEQFFHYPEKYLTGLSLNRASDRQQRSERREAIARVGQVLFDHLDLVTLRVVHWVNDRFEFLSIKDIARKAQMGIKRCHRALTELKRAGCLHIRQLAEHLPNGGIKPLVAIKELSILFFEQLGISHLKLKSRQKSALKYRKRQKKEEIAQESAAGCNDDDKNRLSGLLSELIQSKRTPSHNEKTRQVHKDEHFKRHQAQVYLDLHKTHSDWPPERVRSTMLQMTASPSYTL